MLNPKQKRDLERYLLRWMVDIDKKIAGLELIIADQFAPGSIYDRIVSESDGLRVTIRQATNNLGIRHKLKKGGSSEIADCDCED